MGEYEGLVGVGSLYEAMMGIYLGKDKGEMGMDRLVGQYVGLVGIERCMGEERGLMGTVTLSARYRGCMGIEMTMSQSFQRPCLYRPKMTEIEHFTCTWFVTRLLRRSPSCPDAAVRCYLFSMALVTCPSRVVR